MASRRHAKRRAPPPIDDEHHDDSTTRESKRLKVTREDLFSSYMMDDAFRLLLRFFVSESGAVDGDSLRNIMLVSKRWYAAANSQSLWTVPGAQQEEKENIAPYIPSRPSPLIRDTCHHPAAENFSNLIGFRNMGIRITDDGRPSYNVCERATGKLFFIDILDADDKRAIQEAASSHHLAGDTFLKGTQNDSSSLFLPIGMESLNGRVVRWFKQADSLSLYLQNERSVPMNIKQTLRQLLSAVQEIHATGVVHCRIDPQNIYVDSSDKSETKVQLVCPFLYPVVSLFETSTSGLEYLSPELLIPLSKGLRIHPTPAADIWSIGCVIAQIINDGESIFGADLGVSDYHNGGANSLALYARKVCRIVGASPSCLRGMRSHRHNEFPVDSTESLRRLLTTLEDDEGQDLMAKLLSPDPDRRPTAEEALAHPFLSGKAGSQPLSASTIVPAERALARISLHVSRESLLPPPNPNRNHLRMDAWATLVDYIVEIVEVFDLDIAAAFQALEYFDRFFSSFQGSSTFTSRRCQLVVGTCLYIACKCYETGLSKGDLVYSADNTFNPNDISIAEEVILHELNWKLSFSTILDFLQPMCDALELGEESKPRLMACYIAELALQSQVYLSYKPSLVASCVVALALCTVGATDPWPEALEQATGYSWNDLEQCTMALSSDIHHMRVTMPELKIISRRYRKSQNGRVSLIHIPRITVFAALRNPRT